MRQFLTPKDKFPPITCRVFQDYDKLDAIAEARGYKAVEPEFDEKYEAKVGSGSGNGSLHCGWIATVGDTNISVNAQVDLLKAKIARCVELKENVIIGFCQTGNFSISYSIYVRSRSRTDVNEGFYNVI